MIFPYVSHMFPMKKPPFFVRNQALGPGQLQMPPGAVSQHMAPEDQLQP